MPTCGSIVSRRIPQFLAKFFSLVLILGSLFIASAIAQETLGGLNGTITDNSGAVVQGVTVKARALATNLEVTAQSKESGSFSIADLPIGTYEVAFTKDGFQTAIYPQIILQGNRTATVNAILKPGAVSSTVTVEATPLLNQTDTANSYTMGAQQIEAVPLGSESAGAPTSVQRVQQRGSPVVASAGASPSVAGVTSAS